MLQKVVLFTCHELPVTAKREQGVDLRNKRHLTYSVHLFQLEDFVNTEPS